MNAVYLLGQLPLCHTRLSSSSPSLPNPGRVFFLPLHHTKSLLNPFYMDGLGDRSDPRGGTPFAFLGSPGSWDWIVAFFPTQNLHSNTGMHLHLLLLGSALCGVGLRGPRAAAAAAAGPSLHYPVMESSSSSSRLSVSCSFCFSPCTNPLTADSPPGHGQPDMHPFRSMGYMNKTRHVATALFKTRHTSWVCAILPPINPPFVRKTLFGSDSIDRSIHRSIHPICP